MKQLSGDARRRWFVDDELDLVVWYHVNGALSGFQLCYPGPEESELSLTWGEASGFVHAKVDVGADRPDKNLAPVLVLPSPVPWAELLAAFERCSGELEQPVREFVIQRLQGGAA